MMFGYPRPQLERSNWTSLDGPWQFAFDHEQRWRTPAEVTEWPLSIEVPYPPESMASGIHDTTFHAASWYRRQFDAPAGDGRVMLHFGAVDYQAEVWVNGRLAVFHEGGHTPFSADITSALRHPNSAWGERVMPGVLALTSNILLPPNGCRAALLPTSACV